MKTNFHASAKKKHKSKRILLFVIILVVILNVFDVVWPQSILRSILVPMTMLRNTLSSPFVALHTLFASKDYLVREQKRLQDRVTELEVSTLQSMVDQSLVDAMTLERTYTTSGVQLPVLMRPPFSPYDTLVIDRRISSVAVGDLVFAYGVLIGRVSFVDTATATVQLYTSPHTTTVARIGSIDVNVIGQGGGRYIATLPKDVAIEVGTAVIVPQIEHVLLGVVSAINIQNNGTFQDAHISLPVALHQLTVVTVTSSGDMVQ